MTDEKLKRISEDIPVTDNEREKYSTSAPVGETQTEGVTAQENIKPRSLYLDKLYAAYDAAPTGDDYGAAEQEEQMGIPKAPTYAELTKKYARETELAKRDAMGAAVARTGGMANSYAGVAGENAKQAYLDKLYAIASDGGAKESENTESTGAESAGGLEAEIKGTNYKEALKTARNDPWSAEEYLKGMVSKGYISNEAAVDILDKTGAEYDPENFKVSESTTGGELSGKALIQNIMTRYGYSDDKGTGDTAIRNTPEAHAEILDILDKAIDEGRIDEETALQFCRMFGITSAPEEKKIDTSKAKG